MADPLTTKAISWGFSAASWLISPILSCLLNKCYDALGVDLQLQSEKQILLGKLVTLETTLLPKLRILTDAAQQSPHRPFLDKWLQKLKSAFYEAEHMLGLVEYRRLEKEVNSLFPSTSKYFLKKLKRKFSCEKKNLIKSLENLEKIVNEAMEFVPLLNLPRDIDNTSTWTSVQTISAPGSKVIGREKDRNYIVNLLRADFPESSNNDKSNNDKCYSVIGIWGMGGLGKTTLAQYVCDYEKEVKYFDRVMWAHVSQKFSVDAILRMIWESAFMEACPKFDSLEGLQSALQEKLRGEMYFLVLDDVWCDKGVSEQELEQLFVPLRVGKRGSKILVTTRIEAAAKALGAINPIPLRELDDEQFLSLFISNAIGDAQISDIRMKGRLISIGKDIAAKLRRSPLAAKTMAAQLRRTLDPEFWLSMLNRSLINDTIGALFLSYQHLPPPLQRCFAFCSLFPKGHQFGHDHLVNLWIAEGFIETKDSNEHMKDIGNRYILELISSSFFQDYKPGYYFTMHDLIHDLAQHVSEGEYIRIECREKKEIPAHTRHIYVENCMLGEYMEKICKLKDLRTIIACRSWCSYFSLKEGDFHALFTKLKKLYVVEIEGILLDVKRVSKFVVQLRNLRYLNFKYYNLDAHYVSLCYQLRFLSTESENPIPNVGRLISLHDLTGYCVRMQRGFELKQLEHLKDLYGSLSIYGLNNVKSKEEAYRAKLSHKKGIRKLLFQWDYRSGDIPRDNDVEILDGLCPPPQIKELVIQRYSGKRFPTWILENNDNVIHLQHLELSHCDGIEALHRINELSDLLSLSICFLPRFKTWVPLPLSLTQLEISNCLPIAFAVKEDLDMIMSTKGTRISQIVTFKEMMNDFIEDSISNFLSVVLSIDYQFNEVMEMMKYGDDIKEETLSTISKDLNKCLEKRLDLICQLKDVYGEPFLPPALERLSIKLCFITDKILAVSLQGLTSLTHLRLEHIITITCISKEILSSLTNLLNLKIHGCLLLTSIGGLDTHSTLETLHISLCPNLMTFETSLVVASCTLKYVQLRGCMLPDDMLQGLISLEKIFIWDIPTMVNSPIGHFKALRSLELRNCPNLVALRGLNELTNLEHLELVYGCDKLKCFSHTDKLSQLKELRINRFSLLEQLISRDGFTSLVSLELYGAQQEYFSREECDGVFCYLNSLTDIIFTNCKMHSLPNLMCLHSLIYLEIYGCENLRYFSDVSPSIQGIYIQSCNEKFVWSCKDPNHPNWHKISHIPDKIIPQRTQQYKDSR
ncbi:putative disease resistance RPP13-like protein 1 [Carex rostrata]